MIYVLLTYLFYPFLYLLTLLKKKNPPESPYTPLWKRDNPPKSPFIKGERGGLSREFKKILVIQTAKIGDMICSTPVFREIKKKYPMVFLGVIGDPLSQSVLDNNPYVDETIPVKHTDMKGFLGKLRVANRLRKNNFDMSISLQPNVANNVIPLWALIQKRYSIYPNFCGLTFKCSSLLNTLNVPHVLEQSIVDTYIRLLNKSIGIPIRQDSTRLELHPSITARNKVEEFFKKEGVQDNKLVGMALAARNKLKELAPYIFAKAADRIFDEFNCKVILIAGSGDKGVMDEVKKHMTTTPVDSCGVFTLSELPALMEKLSLFISVDSGPIYMAEAMGVPIINIAGPCAMSERPLGDKAAIVQKKLPCVPCSYTFSTAEKCMKGDRECIESVSVDEILIAVKKLLGR